MDGLKVAVIGGGSSYTPELVEGLIRHYHQFPVKHLYLVDIEPGRAKLDTVGALAQRMVEAAKVPMQVHLSMNRREAIAGADFVTTQLRVGLLEARARDERIPLAHGCIGQETTGAGGFAKALRTIPVILDICRDIQELAPQAYLLNFTNPAGIVTEAVLKHTNVRCIGLCNLPIGMRMQIAKLFDADVTQVFTEMVGINHLNWTTRVFLDGQDVTQSVLEKTAESSAIGVKNIPDLAWDSDLLRALGAIPCSYLRYYYMPDEMLAEQLEAAKTTGTRAEVVKQVEHELFELYKDSNLREKPPQLALRGGAYYSEAAVQLMTSIYTNRRDIQTVNVRNGSIMPFLPPDASIEVNCVIDAQGAHPLQLQSDIAPAMRGLLQVVKAYEELTVTAAVDGDMQAALNALTIHPLVTSAGVANRLLGDIFQAHREYLPQFAHSL